MSPFTAGRRARGRARGGSIALLLLALAPPLPASANHTTCETGGTQGQSPRPDDCPSVSLNYEPVIEPPIIDAPSSLAFRSYQTDHASPVVRATYYVPKGWRFAVESATHGTKAGGLPAVECKDMFDGAGGFFAANLVRGELLSEDAGMLTRFGNNRSIAVYGIGGMGPAGPTGLPGAASNDRRASVSFFRWTPPTAATPGTADLCVYLFTDSGFITHATGAKEIFLPVRLVQIPADDAQAAKWSWRIELDMSTFVRNKFVYDNALSVLYNTLGVAAYSRRRTVGEDGKERWVNARVFSRAPRESMLGEFRGDFVTCREGITPPAAAVPPNPVCRNNAELTVTSSRLVSISPAPEGPAHNFGLVDGPGELFNTGPGTGPDPVAGFSLVRGTMSPTVFWGQPLVDPTHTVKGYVLAVAETGDEETLHLEYFVTQRHLVDERGRVITDGDGNPAPNPEFDQRAPCGEDGALSSCSFDLPFPMSSIGGKILDGNAKYDLALITVYTDGHRTDGLCDDGTPQGARCDPSLPAFTVRAPGVSTWQFLMRSEAWPNAYLETSTQTTTTVDPATGTASAVTIRNPRFLLLADFFQKSGEFIVWGANAVYPLQRQLTPSSSVPALPLFGWAPGFAQQGKERVYAGRSTAILGSGNVGLVSFGDFKPDGASATFRFDGILAPRTARGTFILYDPRNWTVGGPPSIPPDPTNPMPRGPCISVTGERCTPSTLIEPFEGEELIP